MHAHYAASQHSKGVGARSTAVTSASERLCLPQDTSSAALLRLLGLRADTFATAAVSALGATAVLYAGPLLMALLDHDPADRQARSAAIRTSGSAAAACRFIII